MSVLKNKTVVITGASRGIGRTIALAAARRGANIVIAAKTAEPHAKLSGTIHTVADEVRALGVQCLPLQVDVRDHQQVFELMQKAAEQFGGIDIIVNNAGAISLTTVENTRPPIFDRMMNVNARAVYLTAHAALPYLKQSSHAHILSLSPPLNMEPRWFSAHAPYTLSKYGMTMLSIGMADEFRAHKVAVNCLWPRTIIATAAIEFALAGREAFNFCRKPDIMADAAIAILESDPQQCTGHTFIDEDILREHGTNDFSRYAENPQFAEKLKADLFMDDFSGLD